MYRGIHKASIPILDFVTLSSCYTRGSRGDSLPCMQVNKSIRKSIDLADCANFINRTQPCPLRQQGAPPKLYKAGCKVRLYTPYEGPISGKHNDRKLDVLDRKFEGSHLGSHSDHGSRTDREKTPRIHWKPLHVSLTF